ncbi:MAG: hypothetical protein J0I47_00235 [Sphingomonas sp.]|uniref:hypothetical protein n=1 Tax=Sphingomonas sp. TaxID=28214 RepID=UPI001ACAD33A|nr:hypothetical protein [Sphingomonas sp.]MBN8806656.1 hypothetical protein [Sphingomonas sp.]
MNALAQQRLAALAGWFDRNSRQGWTPLGDKLLIGQFAAIVPTNFAEPPPVVDYHPDALPFFVSDEACVGMSFADFETGAPATQDRGDQRLSHVLWLVNDGKLPPFGLVPLIDPREPIGEAVARAGLAIDLDAFPVLAVPLWPLNANAQYVLGHRLPFAPKPGAADPDMPTDPMPAGFVGSDRF